MIRTKSGVPLKIVSGSKKSITGRKPFEVECVVSPEVLLRMIAMGANALALTKPFKLRKDEFLYDNEDELYEALKLKKD